MCVLEYCNPLDLNYKYQHYGKAAHREGADPTLILFKGRYYLFVSMSAGFYYSDDLTNWQWHENRDLDIYNYAPDVRQHGDYLYFTASSRAVQSNIWRTKDPLSDEFEKVSAPFAFWDPDLFFDDDGRVYLYWGCGNIEPIWCIELNPITMEPIGERVPVIDQNIAAHGWERFHFPGKEPEKRTFPMNIVMAFLNRKGNPYMEGAYMNKWNGKYYLQYAAPGTEYHLYGDGYYVGDSPIGPFTFMPNTPFSLKPGGFITGAGHGSTIEDKYGNLWHAATMRISVNEAFERRVGLFPAKLDTDGMLHCNQNFADYPIAVPEGSFDADTLEPQHMLLSYKKKVNASSCLPGHSPEFAVDESIRTWWCAEGCESEWIRLDLGDVYVPHSIQLNFADEGVPVKKVAKAQRSGMETNMRYVDSGTELRTQYILEASVDGENWFVVKDLSGANTDLPHPYFVLPENMRMRYIRLTGVALPYGSRLAVSGIRVFGKGNGEKCAPVVSAKALMEDCMTCRLVWQGVKGAQGYNVRYGIAPDKLYNSWLVYDCTELLLSTLNADQKYYYAIDAFNENGITKGTVQAV